MMTRIQKWTCVIISMGLVQLGTRPKPHPKKQNYALWY